ncbi:transcriptional regulator, GntR family [Roseovarius azorensis]|uniref:Transcriptional regulator, GntR family n=1 Tax=Roseovarius azorensis TaxID=1287727 RepID=A0A1H7N230_9RHOB|nr:GntR family transcriptional regulator [Roseovarius azorensis]SEL17570.1 transcriptional regulator, GntR family [Roseovarius azorensis]
MNLTEASADTPHVEIYNRIWLSIAERKLKPGTRLKEEQLAEIFSVSRARVRQALAALEHDGLVTLVPNRGAFVSQPSIEEARDIFFARRTIETQLVSRLCHVATPQAIARLEAHVAEERAARAAADTKSTVRLSGAFHLLIGELAGSPYLWEALRDLLSRTSLIIVMYQTRSQTDCGPDEHAEIVAAIARGDADRARHLMDHHIDHLEGQLDLDQDTQDSSDLRDLLA